MMAIMFWKMLDHRSACAAALYYVGRIISHTLAVRLGYPRTS
jgi:hypothetical protein